MSELFIPIILFILVVTIIKMIFTPNDKPHLSFKQRALLTQSEKTFFRALEKANNNQYYIFTKVRLADIVQPAEKGRKYWKAFAKIRAKHIDFVLVEKDTLKIFKAIELNDSSHRQSTRRKRDLFLRKLLAETNIEFIEITVASNYDRLYMIFE